ncbi:DUF6493 family protein [Streptomyces sp. NPDC013953]|uniref:DUF7824 domain-containing protein n=1 Tax=Streptomyces sp. NPDC013953 TaxID=3364868 RepID=UPI0036F9FD75
MKRAEELTREPAEPAALLTAVREGRRDDVPGLLEALGPAGRRAALDELKALRKELRGWGWERWEERRRVARALLVAGAGCHTGAAAAAAWIGARDLRDWERLPCGMLLDLLADRSPEWLGDVAHRLAGRAATAEEDYGMIAGLVRVSGCPVPVTDGFVHGWADTVASGGILATLRSDPHTRVLVPRLFLTAEPAATLTWRGEDWQAALVALAAEGAVDRAELVDACVARLLRGGRAGGHRFFLALLRRLELTPAEERARTADWMGMAADATSTVAGHAQDVLARLAGSGDLSARELAEVSASVLFRTEKKLVRAQLVLLGKALRRGGPDTAAELLPAVAEAFGHEDSEVRERALKLVGRHLAAVGERTRTELAEAAAVLGPAHRAAAAEAFGGALPPETWEAGPYKEILPPAPRPQRVDPAAGSLPELVEDLAALLVSNDDVIGVERALDGLVRHAHRDGNALREALLPLVAGLWWYKRDTDVLRHLGPLDTVVGAVVGKVTTGHLDAALRARPVHTCVHRALDLVREARAQEAALSVLERPVPFLLATPTWHTGAVDPGELVERLTAYRRLGARPGELDFAQALLRVRRSGPAAAEAAGAAARLGTPEGQRLAQWLTSPEPVAPALRAVMDAEDADGDSPFPWGRALLRRIVLTPRAHRVIERDFPPAFHWLGRARAGTGRNCYHWDGWAAHWTAVLPEDRETLAAWLLPIATSAADDLRGGARSLPQLVEAGGEAGPAVHLVLATGLGARHVEDRLAAVDALLVLAARGELDAALLGKDLAELVRLGTVKPNRLADAARTAAATGAYATTWSVLGSALPGLFPGGEPVRGLGEILGVAADCVERCGAPPHATGTTGVIGTTGSGAPAAGTAAARDGMDAVDALAARRGSSQLVSQAKRLVKALANTSVHETGHAAPELVENTH